MKSAVSASYRINPDVVMRVKAKLRAKGEKLRAHDARVGIGEEDASKPIIKYTGEEGKKTLGEIALIHEFGGRSWFRSWFDLNAERMRTQMARAMRAEQQGNTTAVETLTLQWAFELRAWITTGRAGLAPLAESTRRQRSRMGLPEGPPLFAIGQIVEAIKAYLDGRVVG